MKIITSLLACILLVSCATTQPPGPTALVADPAVQAQLVRTTEAIMSVKGDKAWDSDSEGIRAARSSVGELEALLKGDRIQALNQLLYFVRWTAKGEMQGWGSVALFNYFAFTAAEIHQATDLYIAGMDIKFRENVEDLLPEKLSGEGKKKRAEIQKYLTPR